MLTSVGSMVLMVRAASRVRFAVMFVLGVVSISWPPIRAAMSELV